MLSFVMLVIGFVLLVWGADKFVEGASALARKMGVSPLLVGLTIVAFGTSMPELAVSVTAALRGANEIAVGNVVLNRVADERFPNSVKEVVFDRRSGVAQFSPTADGSIGLTPDEDAVLAAKLAFEGYNTVGESMYFINPAACNSAWFNRCLTYTTTIGDHVFYA